MAWKHDTLITIKWRLDEKNKYSSRADIHL